MAFLLFAGRTDAQDALDKAISFRTVGTKTPLAPQHGRSECLFRGIVRWLHPGLAHKRPERIPMFQQFLADRFARIPAPRPRDEERVHAGLDWFHGGLHLGTVDPAALIHVPQPKHDVAQGQPIGCPQRDLPASLRQCQEVADQMRPAQLPERQVDPGVPTSYPRRTHVAPAVPSVPW